MMENDYIQVVLKETARPCILEVQEFPTGDLRFSIAGPIAYATNMDDA